MNVSIPEADWEEQTKAPPPLHWVVQVWDDWEENIKLMAKNMGVNLVEISRESKMDNLVTFCCTCDAKTAMTIRSLSGVVDVFPDSNISTCD